MNPIEAPARPLRIGERAPLFRARSTRGDVSLEAYRGRWLVFFSHPADFTPVCTSEFVALAGAAERFAALDCALLGLSVDSLYAHIAWLREIRRVFGVSVDFPLIEDPSMAIGRAYGMLDDRAADSSSVRATYFIDPAGIIRAILWYPATVGRSVDEMLRVLAALQRTSAEAVMTPEGWQPGDDLLLPPEEAALAETESEGAWFWRTRKGP